MSKELMPLMWYTKEFPKETFEEALKRAKTNDVLIRLKQIVDSRLEQMEAQDRSSLEPYENASWAYSQAHRNGRKHELFVIQSLLSFIK